MHNSSIVFTLDIMAFCGAYGLYGNFTVSPPIAKSFCSLLVVEFAIVPTKASPSQEILVSTRFPGPCSAESHQTGSTKKPSFNFLVGWQREKPVSSLLSCQLFCLNFPATLVGRLTFNLLEDGGSRRRGGGDFREGEQRGMPL